MKDLPQGTTKSHLDEIIQDYLFDNDMTWSFIHEKIKMRAFISAEQKEYYEKRIKALRTPLISLLEKYGEETKNNNPFVHECGKENGCDICLKEEGYRTAEDKVKEILSNLK